MYKGSNKFAALIFIAIGVFLLIYSRVPGQGSLLEDHAQIIRIVSFPVTRYNVELSTSEGTILRCVENTLNQWPPEIINRCPIDKFKPYIGQTVKVLHDGEYLYEVKTDNQTILSYNAFQKFKLMMNLFALIMIAIGIITWRRAGKTR